MDRLERAVRLHLTRFRRLASRVLAGDLDADRIVRAEVDRALAREPLDADGDPVNGVLVRAREALREAFVRARGGAGLVLVPWSVWRERTRILRFRLGEQALLSSAGASGLTGLIAAAAVVTALSAAPLPPDRPMMESSRIVAHSSVETLVGPGTLPAAPAEQAGAGEPQPADPVEVPDGVVPDPGIEQPRASTEVRRRENIEIYRRIYIGLLGETITLGDGSGRRYGTSCDPDSIVKTTLCSTYDQVEDLGLIGFPEE